MLYPDNWVVIKIKTEENGIIYKVLAGWSGGYTQGSSWKLNSGITGVSLEDDRYIFKGHSGSIYSCHKNSYGLRVNNAYIWNRLQELCKDKVEMMPEDTDWLNVDWLANKV